MRRTVCIILIIIILIQMIMPIISIGAEEIIASSDSRFKYTINSDGTATITKYVGTDTELVIPSSLDGVKVTSIGRYAFLGCSSLSSIELPEGLTSIGNSAFLGCSSLSSIEIPDGVTSIGKYAFNSCSSLRSINVNEDNSSYMDDEGVLYNKGRTQIIKYPANKEGTKYTILEGVTTIESSAFSGCSSLSNIEIPEGVTSIGLGAFSGCSSLSSIELPEGITVIDNGTFEGCRNLSSIKIPEGVTSIGEYAFSNCSSLSSIELPDGVTSIGRETFKGCSSLSSIKLPGGLTSIGSYAFKGCSSLSGIELPEGVTSIGVQAFSGCTSLSSIELPEGVTSIEGSTFEGCSSLSSIELPEGLTSIGNYVFKGCSSLNSIELPEGITVIGNGTFEGCRNLSSIKLPEGVTSIGEFAFYVCRSLSSIKIPEGVTSIGKYAFSNCSNLSSIKIPKGVTVIDKSTFIECSSLSSIELPEGVTSIGENAFNNCSNLSSIELPEGVTSIGEKAFYRCNSLNSIELPEGVTSIGENAFSNCSNLSSIKIPKGVTVIDKSTFYECSNLSSIELPEGVTSIGEKAFYRCNSLNSIELPEGVTSIGGYAFYNCSSLSSITIPDSVTSIGRSAFEGCISLSSIIIPEGVTSIDEDAFSFRSKLICKNNSTAHTYAIDNDIVYTLDDTVPTIKYSTNGNTTPSKTQGTKVIVSDEIAGVKANALKYLWSTSSNTPEETDFIESFENGEVLNKTEGDGEWYLWVLAKDNLYNTSIVKSNVFNLDNTSPTVTVEYSKTEPTNQDVIVTIKANEEVQEVVGWTLLEDTKTLTKTYQQNETETLIIKDLAGNETEVNVNVANIDKVVPEAIVEYSETEITNEDVIVTIKANEEVQEVVGWTLLEDTKTLTKTYQQNETETLIIKDLAGNEKQVEVNVGMIDKEAPTVIVEYSRQDPTKEEVIVKIKVNEEIQEVTGWTLSVDKKTLTKIYSTNESETITIKDIIGNETEVQVNVVVTDKEAPTATVEYSKTEPTNQDVMVTIKANEQIQEVEGWTLSVDKKTLTKTYSANGIETITIKDIAGNQVQVTVTVKNIDKVAPEIKGLEEGKTYSKVTLQITDENLSKIVLTKDGKEVTYQNGQEIKEKGTYTITAEDKAGNKTSITFKIQEQIEIKDYIVEESYVTNIKTGTKIAEMKNSIQSNTNYEIQTKTGEKVEENAIIATGMKIVFETGKEYVLVVTGDTNGDGKVSITDLTKIKKHIIGQQKLENEYEKAGDLNENNNITVTDLAKIKKVIVGLINL